MRHVAWLCLAVGLSGCAVAVPRYTVSADTVAALRAMKGATVSVGAFTGPGKRSILCRLAGEIQPPDGETFEGFIRKALIDELQTAELYTPSSPLVLTGVVETVDFSSMLGSATWDLVLTLSSSGGQQLTATERYPFASAFAADSACNEAAKAFLPAVQNLIRKAVGDPAFRRLVAAPG
jgi:hypothetical protein